MRVFFAADGGYTVSKIEVRSDPAPGGYRTSRKKRAPMMSRPQVSLETA